MNGRTGHQALVGGRQRLGVSENVVLTAYACALGAVLFATIIGGGRLGATVALTLLLVIAAPYVLTWRVLAGALAVSIVLVPSDLYRLGPELPINLDAYRVMIGLAAIVWFAALLVDDDVQLPSTRMDREILLLVLAVLVSFIVNLGRLGAGDEFSVAAKALLYFLGLPLLFYLIVSVVRDPRDVAAVLRVIVIVGAVVSALGIVERHTGYNVFRHLDQGIPILRPGVSLPVEGQRGGVRVAGSTTHPIAFSVLLSMILPIAIHFAFQGILRWRRAFYAIASVLIGTAILLTGSRTGLIGLVVVIGVQLLGHPERRRTMVVASLMFVMLVHMAFPGTLATLQTWISPSHIEKTEVGNKAGRLEDYPRVWKELVKYPAFGRGYGTFLPENFFYVDNQYLKFAVEIGLLGLSLVLVFFRRVIIEMWHASTRAEPSERSLLVALLAGAVVFAVSFATFDTFGFAQVPYLFFLLLALGTSLCRCQRATASPINPEAIVT